MKTEDAIDLTLMSALALAITILIACLAEFPVISPFAGFGIIMGTLFVIATAILPRIDPQNLNGENI